MSFENSLDHDINVLLFRVNVSLFVSLVQLIVWDDFSSIVVHIRGLFF